MKYLFTLAAIFIGLILFKSNFQKPTENHVKQAAQLFAHGIQTAFTYIFDLAQLIATLISPSLATFLPWVILGLLSLFLVRKVA